MGIEMDNLSQYDKNKIINDKIVYLQSVINAVLNTRQEELKRASDLDYLPDNTYLLIINDSQSKIDVLKKMII